MSIVKALLMWLFVVSWTTTNPSGALAQQQEQQQVLQPAQVSCNARYSAPCARTNAEWLARSVASRLQSTSNVIRNKLLASITEQDEAFNRDVGFYAFVFERDTARCVAHGSNAALVGLSLSEVFRYQGITYSDADALHERFRAANNDWVQYLWADEGRVNSKLAFVVNITDSPYYLGVGYENEPLPVDTPCSDDYDSWCSLTNVRSLVGKAQFALYQAESLEAFESTVFEISFDDEDYTIPKDFYLFMYHFDGPLKAHGVLRNDAFGKSLTEIFVINDLGTAAEGQALHQQFVDAVTTKDSGFVQYTWRNSLDEEPYEKIAFLVKVSFGDDDYYLGAGYNFAVDEFLSAPLDAACTDEYNLPCSFKTAYQLSAHALSHSVASQLSVSERFQAITREEQFKHENFYVFVYTFENECVAHGANEDYVGMSLNQVFDLIDIPLDATELHEKFRSAAQNGGGWVLYDWLNLKTGAGFEKISYIFQINIDGQDYYGGIGFNHQRAPVQVDANGRFFKNERAIPCSSEYGLECSEVNARAILGQALAALTLSSSEASAVQTGDSTRRPLQDVLNDITFRSDDLLSVNDFYVNVFSFGDNEACETRDGSGCAVAYGSNPEYWGKTWTEILDAQGASSIQGVNLHQRLIGQSNTGGDVVEYSWQGNHQRAWTARFRHEGESYYIVAEYSPTEMPATCEACPSGMHCLSGGQDFCTPIPGLKWYQEPAFISVLVIFCVGAAVGFYLFRRQKRKSKLKLLAKEEEVKRMAARLEQQMQGVFQVMTDLPIRDPEEYKRKVGADAKDKSTRNQAARWYWKEDDSRVDQHIAEMVKTGTNFVSYSGEICGQIEHAYRLYQEGKGYDTLRVDLTNKITSTKSGQKLVNADSGNFYEISFEQMVQSNSKTNFKRAVDREEITIHNINSEVYDSLPFLPDDIDFTSEDKEDILPTFHGQIIQVSKIHPNGEWFFGNVLYDPLMEEAAKGPQAADDTTDNDLKAILANALHDRPTSGWFPRAVTQAADVKQMHKLLKTLGGDGSDVLAIPDHWDESAGGNVEVKQGTAEYNEVVTFFTRALYGQRDKVKVESVHRVQNVPLWQSYSVKKQTMRTRFADGTSRRVNNVGDHLDTLSRRWLFHGSRSETMGKIAQQGFNRSFAGLNAVAYGRGVYFARDASYSSHPRYSAPDEKGVQHMFMCRVLIGDWSKGSHDQITPEAKPYNAFELFDSTVDNVSNPSIFVVYHDSQAYPEYLVSFKQDD
eukprot:CAMPEP_0117013264 /NCGR_PEP_ID=MMETSP0472-20121206/10982_1 /TAXON_ID=693140 ORGANISM="Tiarina fusus, Strain LIS" /NCGR_SAMPLE_ID=MMETSP0472 /ASSEMBLY_ACC=CAM_ASM_000603 /LENGTH=1244 /DNA_ID=CAMNT_0004716535 /DNA_START=123 /DNA_END=3857 /DNA_ORIENTATION=+